MSQIENMTDALTGVTRGYDFFRKKIRVALAAGVTPEQIVNQIDGADDQIAREMMRRTITQEIEERRQQREIETGETINIEAITDTTIIDIEGDAGS